MDITTGKITPPEAARGEIITCPFGFEKSGIGSVSAK